MHLSPRGKRKLEIEKLAARHTITLQQYGIDLKAIIGCSTQGCAYLMGNGQVAKLTIDWDEIRLAQWAKLYQAQFSTHPCIPRIDVIKLLEPGLFLIIRENLSDLQFDNPDWFDDEIADHVFRLYRKFIAEHQSKKIPYRTALSHYHQQLQYHFEKVTQRAEDAGYEDVWPDDIDRVYEIQKCIMWLLEHHILVCDIITDNWGVREDGTIVIRDLGCNNAPIVEAELFLPYPPLN